MRTGRKEKMAALETNWVILSMHSWTAWVVVLPMVIPIMMMVAVDLKVMMCDGEDGEVDG